MAGYSKKLVRYILDNYWELKSGSMGQVGEHRINKGQRSGWLPSELMAIMCADFDTAFDKLDKHTPGKWLSLSATLTERELERIVGTLCREQQTIARYYLCPNKYRVEGATRLQIALRTLVKYMNGE